MVLRHLLLRGGDSFRAHRSLAVRRRDAADLRASVRLRVHGRRSLRLHAPPTRSRFRVDDLPRFVVVVDRFYHDGGGRTAAVGLPAG